MISELELARETEEDKWNGLYNNWSFEGMESPGDYRPAGYHPVHINDYLGDQNKYRVLHKLSSSCCSTNWLCCVRNSKRRRYVAIKIRCARESTDESLEQEREMIERLQEIAKSDPAIAKYCVLPIDEFQIKNGPNGDHHCFVYPALGPNVTHLRSSIKRRPSQFLRHLAYQVVEAVAALHRHGIVHGDLDLVQFLLRDDVFTGTSSRNLIRYLGRPEGIRVHVREGYTAPGPHAPDYLVDQIEYSFVEQTRRTSDRIGLVGFSSASYMSSKPAREPPLYVYSAPEMYFEGPEKCGAPNDIWALACIIYEICIGEYIFNKHAWNDDEFIAHMVMTVGVPLPEPWWSTWEARPKLFKAKPNKRGQVVMADDISDYDSTDDETQAGETQTGGTQVDKIQAGETHAGENNGKGEEKRELIIKTLKNDDVYFPDVIVAHSDDEENDSNVTDLEYSSEEDDLSEESDGDQSDEEDSTWEDYDVWSPLSIWSDRTFIRPDGTEWNDSIPKSEKKLLEDLLLKMLKYNPNERPTAEQVLKHPYFSFERKGETE